MPKPYPQEFRDDVVKVARSRPEGVTLEQVAADFGLHPMTSSKWLRQVAVDDGDRHGVVSGTQDRSPALLPVVEYPDHRQPA
ncbi:MAG: hypothetical protein M5U19_15610 [Microthrixaceae bacterium]|nr:hypothetical protein [Microthrixaceae bacterium]